MKSVVIDSHTIRDRAYARWQERGCPEGTAEQDWLEAERDLAERAARQAEGPEVVAPPSAPASERVKPPRPTLKRSPGARAARLLNDVSPRGPASRTQIALAVAAAAYIKGSAIGSG